MTKTKKSNKSRQKLKYLENEKSFRRKAKSIFIIFKGLSATKNDLRHESARLILRLICFFLNIFFFFFFFFFLIDNYEQSAL